MLINATWSALNVKNYQTKIDPVTERITREIDRIIFDEGCPLNCCNTIETALKYTGKDTDEIPKACKEARQIERCTEYMSEDMCINIITDSDIDAKRHNKKMIQRAAKTKRKALERRLYFLVNDAVDILADYNIAKATDDQLSRFNGGSGLI